MKKIRSFTLIEILVAVFIFTVATALIFSAFYSMASFQAKAKAVRRTTQEARNIMETIVREIRLADSVELSDVPGGYFLQCIPTGKIPPASCPGIKITKENKDLYYYLGKKTGSSEIALIRQEDLLGSKYALNSNDVLIKDFMVSKENSNSNWEIKLVVKNKTQNKVPEEGTIILQTVVYRRSYNQ